MTIMAAMDRYMNALVDQRFAIDDAGREVFQTWSIGVGRRIVPDLITSAMLRQTVKLCYLLTPCVFVVSSALAVICRQPWLFVVAAAATWFAGQWASTGPLASTLNAAPNKSAAATLQKLKFATAERLITSIGLSVPQAAILAEGIAALAAAAGFAAGSPWVTWIWPCQGEPLTAFLFAAFLASYGCGSIFVACFEDWRAATSGGAAAIVIGFGGFAFSELSNAVSEAGTALMPHTFVLSVIAIGSMFALYENEANKPSPSRSPSPAVTSETRVIMLLLATSAFIFGFGLIAGWPDMLPWITARPTMLLLGWLCIGSAVDYAIAGVRGNKSACDTLLLGTLVYDVVMLFPMLKTAATAPAAKRFDLEVTILVFVAMALMCVVCLWRGRFRGHRPAMLSALRNRPVLAQLPAIAAFNR
jgi:hypothetical protein